MKLSDLTKQQIDIIKMGLSITDELDNYVILNEDENGNRYITYAFKDGAPENNDCLSWYDSFQPNQLNRCKHDLDWWKEHRLHEPGHIYRLTMYSCGHDKYPIDDERHCSPGRPKKDCFLTHTERWTYKEPCKCACWGLVTVKSIDDFGFTFSVEQLIKLVDSLFPVA